MSILLSKTKAKMHKLDQFRSFEAINVNRKAIIIYMTLNKKFSALGPQNKSISSFKLKSFRILYLTIE